MVPSVAPRCRLLRASRWVASASWEALIRRQSGDVQLEPEVGHEPRGVVGGERGRDRRADRLGQLGAEHRVDVRPPAVARAAGVGVGLHDHRVTAMGLLDDVGGEQLGVVRTDQPERDLGVDGHVEQRLVQLTLEQFLGAPTGPDRLADAADGAARVIVQELLPGGDDPGRIRTQLVMSTNLT